MDHFERSNLDYVSIMFPHQTKKGNQGFSSAEGIIEVKAYFPNLDTNSCINLWKKCEYENSQVDNIVRLSDIEHQGFNVNPEEQGIELNEYSAYHKKTVKQSFFDINFSNLPQKLSRKQKTKNFYLNDTFINNCIDSFTKSSGFRVRNSDAKQTSIDYDNRTIFFPDNEDKKIKFRSFVMAMIVFEYAPNSNVYNNILSNIKLAKELKIRGVLASYAISRSFNVPVNEENISADSRKNYVWGSTNEEVLKKIDSILQAVQNVSTRAALESNFLQEVKKQEEDKISKYINSKESIDSGSLKQALYDERGRVRDEIEKNVRIEDVLRDFGNVTESPKGTTYKATCPGHEDTKPSLQVTPNKGVCNCFTCGFGGNVFSVVGKLKNIEWAEAVDLIALQYGINTNYDFIKDQFKGNSDKESFRTSLIKKFGESLRVEDYEKLISLSRITDMKKFEIDVSEQIEKRKIYKLDKMQIKPKRVIDVKDSYVVKTESIKGNYDAEKYLSQKRGFKLYPNELRYITGEKTYDDGGKSKYTGVGFVNELNGADIKLYDGKARSVGNKSLTILNKENVNKENPDYIVSESQWDLVAFYNDPICKKVYDNSVVIILNGTAMVDEAVEFMDKTKGIYSGLVILNQADDPNGKAMKRLIVGSAISKVSKVYYTDKDVEEKRDVNDLLKEGISINERIKGGFRITTNTTNEARMY